MLSLATAELALGLVNAAIALGQRVSDIRLKTAIGEELPFALPRLPEDLTPLMQPAIKFFRSDPAGREVLEADKLTGEFAAYATLAETDGAKPPSFSALNAKYVSLYAVLNGVIVREVGDGVVPRGIGRGMWLAAAIVSSGKPGVQRSEFMSIVLATADVVLEFAGANPGLITKNTKVQGVISTFLQKFTVGNLEDFSDRRLFERTLSSLISTAIEDHELIDGKAVGLFIDSLNDLAKADPDFVAGLVVGRGFDNLLRAVLATAGMNIDKFTDDPLLRATLGGFLTQVSNDVVFSRLRADDDALAVLAQIAIGQVARYPRLLDPADKGQLWNAVLKSVVQEVGNVADAGLLFTPGTIASLAHAALGAVGENPALIKDGFVGKLVAGIAQALQQTKVTKLFAPSSLRMIAREALAVAAANTGLLAGNNGFVEKVLAAVLRAGAEGFANDFTDALAIDLFHAAVDAALTNVDFLGLPDVYAQIVGGLVAEFGRDDLRGLFKPGDLLDAFRRVVKVVAANPLVWEKVGGGNLPASVVRAIAEAFAKDPTSLVRGPVLAQAAEAILRAVARRAAAFAEVVAGGNPALVLLLKASLEQLKGEVGRKLAADNVVVILVQLVLDWGEQRFIVDAADPAFKTRIGDVLAKAA